MEIDLDLEPDLDDLRAAFRVEVDGARLEELLTARGLGLVEVRRLVAAGQVRVDRRACFEPRVRPPRGAVVSVVDGDPALLPEAIPLPILFRDDRYLVIDKPARLPMTPGEGHPAGTVANALRGLGVPLSGVEGPLRPGIVHRLDRGTSGCLLVPLTDEAHERAKQLFLARRIHRCYLARVAGTPTFGARTVDAPLGRGRQNRKAQKIRPDGKPAVTHVRVVEGNLVECRPETGRKHQIRVHLAHLGHPILGDTLYGGGNAAAPRRRVMLHAWKLWCEELGIEATAPVPPDFG